MKVMLINGSPHEKDCTYTALMECAKTLKEAGRQAGIPLPEQEEKRIATNFIR